MKRRIAIVGGGVAGLAAAVRLAEAGERPILIETSKRLGGRASSFVDPRTGMVLDNCQHVVMGCCSNLLDFYDRLGVVDHIEWHERIYWTHDGVTVDVMKPGRLPAPLHFSGAFRRAVLFTTSDKRAIARAMWKLLRMGSVGRLEWKGRTFAEFLDACGQPADVVRRFWSTVVVSACNLPVDRVGATHAIQVFQEGFLASGWAATMGLSTVPLADLYEPARAVIEAAGGCVRAGVSARAIAFDGSRISGVVTASDVESASAVIAAVPFDRLDRLVSDTLRRADVRLRHLDRLTCSPILGVHLIFEQPIMEQPHLVIVDRGVDWLFNKGRDELGGQHVHAVISAADDWVGLDEDTIVERVLEDVHAVIPKSRGLRPAYARAVKEKRATFAATPEAEQYRPPVVAGTVGGGVANLYLAGDWVRTGWPATMEGAARSGYEAAAALTGEGGVVPDVPPGAFARVLGLR